jgi:membrane fusion protein (multidrug efflux system)
MYVRVQLEQAKASNAMLLPQQAVTRAGQGDTVMVVDAQGQGGAAPVKVGGSQNGQWVVLTA